MNGSSLWAHTCVECDGIDWRQIRIAGVFMIIFVGLSWYWPVLFLWCS